MERSNLGPYGEETHSRTGSHDDCRIRGALRQAFDITHPPGLTVNQATWLSI